MIYTKDGLTKEEFIELLQYSLNAECQFLTKVKPDTNIINDYVFQDDSIVRLLKMDEYVDVAVQADGTKIYSHRFSVKVLVDDKYWIKDSLKESYYKSEKVPSKIHNDITQILS